MISSNKNLSNTKSIPNFKSKYFRNTDYRDYTQLTETKQE